MDEIGSLKRALSGQGLLFSASREWQGIPYITARQTYLSPDTAFAEYIFVFPSSEQSAIFWEENERFFSNVVENIYYTLQNDLCWNLYLICVLTDASFAGIDRHQRESFESNTEFTRNFVIPFSQLSQRLPIGRSLSRSSSQPIRQPIQEWRQILEDFDFCLEPFFHKTLERYADGTLPPRSKKTKAREVHPLKPIRHIESIQIPQNFRPHFYQSDLLLPCKKVNLFSGANGSGKTSVLSAIELAITGSVLKQRPDASDETEQADVVLSLRIDDKIQPCRKPVTAAQKKDREAFWYNNRSEFRTGEQLNSLFHRFNYFSVDDTYRFVSEQTDMQKVFSRLLFGPEVSAMWTNLQNYRENCQRMLGDLRTESSRLKSELLQPLTEEIYETGLQNYIEQSGLQIVPDLPYDQILRIITTIQAEYDTVSDLAPIPSREEIEKSLCTVKQELAEDRGLAAALQNEYNDRDLRIQILTEEKDRVATRLSQTRRRIKELEPLSDLQSSLQFLCDFSAEIQTYQNHAAQENELQADLSRYSVFYHTYHSLADIHELPDRDSLNEKLLHLSIQHSACQERLTSTSAKIEAKEQGLALQKNWRPRFALSANNWLSKRPLSPNVLFAAQTV